MLYLIDNYSLGFGVQLFFLFLLLILIVGAVRPKEGVPETEERAIVPDVVGVVEVMIGG